MGGGIGRVVVSLSTTVPAGMRAAPTGHPCAPIRHCIDPISFTAESDSIPRKALPGAAVSFLHPIKCLVLPVLHFDPVHGGRARVGCKETKRAPVREPEPWVIVLKSHASSVIVSGCAISGC